MADKSAEVSRVEDPIKPYLQEGEVFITNSADGNDDNWKMSLHREDERSGQQLASELMSYGEHGKWESVRVVNKAFDVNGQPIKGMVALVGTPKA